MSTHVAVGKGRHFLSGCWQETWLPRHVDLSLGLPECPLMGQLAFPRARDPKESKVGAAIPFMTGPWSLHITFSISYWSHRSAPFSVGGGYTEAHHSGQKDNWGSSWRLATTRGKTWKILLKITISQKFWNQSLTSSQSSRYALLVKISSQISVS